MFKSGKLIDSGCGGGRPYMIQCQAEWSAAFYVLGTTGLE